MDLTTQMSQNKDLLEKSQNDENACILLDGYKKYHNAQIKTTLDKMAHQLKDARLTEDVINKRKI